MYLVYCILYLLYLIYFSNAFENNHVLESVSLRSNNLGSTTNFLKVPNSLQDLALSRYGNIVYFFVQVSSVP